MTLYLLDKNVVEDIHGALRGVHSKEIRVAREIDRRGNIVSPLLAALEGSEQRPLAAAELHESVLRDAHAVGMFYGQARTDARALQEMGMEMALTLGAHMRDKANALLPMTSALQRLLARTYSVADAWDVLQQIDSLAREHAVPLEHPLVTCAVTCLYGNVGARKVLKPAVSPSDEESYNAVADVRLLMETAYIRRMWQESSPRERVQLHTRDKKLNEFARDLRVEATGSTSLEHMGLELVRFTSTISPTLLSNLARDQNQLERVMAHLKGSRDR